MKRVISLIIIAVSLLAPLAGRAADGELFPYPKPPEDMEALTERCDFLISHFWEPCNFKSAMSSPEKLKSCFADWVSFMPYGSADVVHDAIDKLLAKVSKQPKVIAAMGDWAEAYMYSDSADFISDETYLPFAKAVVDCKKIKSAEKARAAAQVRIIENSAVGALIPEISTISREGEEQVLRSLPKCNNVVVFFNDPDCLDCRMARTRMSADPNLAKLVESGRVQVISIYPGDADQEWLADAATYPQGWTVVAAPEADLYFDLRDTPVFYLVNSRGKVLRKNVPLDSLLQAFQTLNK